jgi:hypothetical protein
MKITTTVAQISSMANAAVLRVLLCRTYKDGDD